MRIIKLILFSWILIFSVLADAGLPVIWSSPYPLILGKGGIRFQRSDSATACDTAAAGSIRYNAGTFEACNGSAWATLATGSAGTTYTANQYGVALSSATNATLTILAPDASTTKVLVSGGASANPAWTTLTAPTSQIFTATGTTTGYWFTITSGNATVGSTWTNNTNTYTCLATVASATQVFMSGASAPLATGTLTKASGSGDATLTYSANKALATYTTPANAKFLKITMVGGGGGGGGAASNAANYAGGGGAGGAGTCVKYIASPAGTYYYSVGTAGAGGTAGANNGVAGIQSTFNITYLAGGGALGQGSGAAAVFQIAALGGAGGSTTGCDINAGGNSGYVGWILTTSALSGAGGGSLMGGGGAAVRNGESSANAGSGYGGGGGGASSSNGSGALAGGNGTAGIVIVEEFYQ